MPNKFASLFPVRASTARSGGGTGRHAGLRSLCLHRRGGSSPPSSTSTTSSHRERRVSLREGTPSRYGVPVAVPASRRATARRRARDGATSSGSSARRRTLARSAVVRLASRQSRHAAQPRAARPGSSPRIGPPANASRFCATRSAGDAMAARRERVAIRAQPRIELPLGELAQLVVDVRVLAACDAASARSTSDGVRSSSASRCATRMPSARRR